MATHPSFPPWPAVPSEECCTVTVTLGSFWWRKMVHPPPASPPNQPAQTLQQQSPLPPPYYLLPTTHIHGDRWLIRATALLEGLRLSTAVKELLQVDVTIIDPPNPCSITLEMVGGADFSMSNLCCGVFPLLVRVSQQERLQCSGPVDPPSRRCCCFVTQCGGCVHVLSSLVTDLLCRTVQAHVGQTLSQ